MTCLTVPHEIGNAISADDYVIRTAQANPNDVANYAMRYYLNTVAIEWTE